jgi:hypothetical protein
LKKTEPARIFVGIKRRAWWSSLNPGAALSFGTFKIVAGFISSNFGEVDMENDLNTRRQLDDQRRGIRGGTIAAIVAALLIIGALFALGPWNNGTNSGTASNISANTTTGSANTSAPATTPGSPNSGGNR